MERSTSFGDQDSVWNAALRHPIPRSICFEGLWRRWRRRRHTPRPQDVDRLVVLDVADNVTNDTAKESSCEEDAQHGEQPRQIVGGRVLRRIGSTPR